MTLASEGKPAVGTILDCALPSPRTQILKPGKSPEPGVEVKIGFWANTSTAIVPEFAVGGGFKATAILDIYGTNDSGCGGNEAPIAEAQQEGIGNNCVWLHEGLRLGMAATKPNQHSAYGAELGHVIGHKEVVAPQIESWINAVKNGFPVPAP